MRLILIVYLIIIPTGLGALSPEKKKIPQMTFYEKEANDRERSLDSLRKKMRIEIDRLKYTN